MPTYTYETLAIGDGVARRFELTQSISDGPLKTDPETGLPVKRIITSACSLKFIGLKRSTTVNKKSAAATACGCATGHPHKH